MVDVLAVLLFAAPAYVANSSAVIVGGKFPLDFGKNWVDHKRMLGSGKTVRGTFTGILLGWLAGLTASVIVTQHPIPEYEKVSLLIAVGAITGDAVKSFIKRRVGIEQGREWLLWDQLDFIVGSVVFASPYYLLPALETAILFVVTFALHKTTNLVAYLSRLKSVPW
ncbi:MAG TPA: CDP-2,3-bis-(O-geranylgeranyl)-sn-glycerol synthase [archaeon]|nr:CDP-2,3-bis-(O-geranylgeranyl)-sn-glycerol synthase [archaeon]